MEEAPCPRDPLLYGLLSDEAWESLPWSAWQKGLPEDASTQVRVLSKEWEAEAYGHNYLTLQELTEKYVEILADPRAKANGLQYSLGEVIYTLSSSLQPSVSPEDHRIVFWFH